ncbi:MAG: 30S ribosomal protein S2 [Bdellovibrionales bacterium]|nr:30S ribosomal protein S2 [Bdellovibrionales bacterium]
MTAQITMKDLLEAGVHFGHQTSRWNPKMKPYIFGSRNGIYIIDLQKTVVLAKDALTYVTQIVSQGKKVLFVGTKAQSKDVIREEAERCGCPYVNERWLGGALTNYQTIQGCIATLEKLETKLNSELSANIGKKERSMLQKEHERLMRNLGGIRQMKDLPGAIFIVDPGKEHNAVAEAKVLGIPVIAITDTNCDPDPISYVIPGNDDALKSIRLFAGAIANAVLDGARVFEERVRAIQDKREIEAKVAADSAPIAPAKSAPKSTTTDREGRTVDVQVRRTKAEKPSA